MRSATPVFVLIGIALAVAGGCAQSGDASGHSTEVDHARPRASPADVDVLTGASWSGTLRYTDYTSGTSTTIRSSLRVTRADDPAGPSWEMRYGYADEPEAGRKEILALAEHGRMLNQARVIERAVQPDGSIRLVTERQGHDNHQPATLRYIYLLSPRRCSIEKLVMPSGADAYFQRNIYEWTR